MSDQAITNPKKFKAVLPDDDPVFLHQGIRLSLDRDTDYTSYVTLSVEKVLVPTKVNDPKANAVEYLRSIALTIRDLGWIAARYYEVEQMRSYQELAAENFELRQELARLR